MIIDVIFAILVLMAIFRGYRNGLILGLFSLLAVVVGLAAAMKLSVLTAGYLDSAIRISEKWLPVISFVVTFIAVLLLVRLGARALEKTAQLVTLGWLNKLGGILLFTLLYTMVYSVILFYAGQLNILQPATIEDSAAWPVVQPLGPRVLDGMGNLIPVFRDMFGELEGFFGRLAEKAADPSTP